MPGVVAKVPAQHWHSVLKAARVMTHRTLSGGDRSAHSIALLLVLPIPDRQRQIDESKLRTAHGSLSVRNLARAPATPSRTGALWTSYTDRTGPTLHGPRRATTPRRPSETGPMRVKVDYARLER